MTVIKTEGAAPNRRIFFDEKVVGQTPETVTVKCGSHVVKLGSSGKPQTIDLPCGAEITIGDK
jgi:serine/threonine-protein kinase